LHRTLRFQTVFVDHPEIGSLGFANGAIPTTSFATGSSNLRQWAEWDE
jgi:hypothetical protein